MPMIQLKFIAALATKFFQTSFWKRMCILYQRQVKNWRAKKKVTLFILSLKWWGLSPINFYEVDAWEKPILDSEIILNIVLYPISPETSSISVLSSKKVFGDDLITNTRDLPRAYVWKKFEIKEKKWKPTLENL